MDQSPSDQSSLIARSRASRLTPGQRDTLRYMLREPEKFMVLSSSAAAMETGVSQPSISRLTQALGFSHYSELIASLRDHQSSRRNDTLYSGTVERLNRVFEHELSLLMELRDRVLGEPNLRLAAESLISSSVALAYGTRISSALADGFSYRLSRIRSGVKRLPSPFSEAADLLALESASEHPVLIVFCLPRSPVDTIKLTEVARSHGVYTIGVTDHEDNAICSVVDIPLITGINWELLFGSHTAAALISSLLVDEASQLREGEHEKRLSMLDEVASELVHYSD